MAAINPWKQWYGSFVPNWLLSRKEVGATEKLLYASLCRHHGRTGRGSYPSVDTLGAEIGSSRRTVFRALANLRDVGLIEIIDRRPYPASYRFLDHPWMHEGGEHAHRDAPAQAPVQDQGVPKTSHSTSEDHKDRHGSHKKSEQECDAFNCGAAPDLAQTCAKSGANTFNKDPIERGEADDPPSYGDQALERRLAKLTDEQAVQVRQVLAAYDRAVVATKHEHYVWSDADIPAAMEAWERADALARRQDIEHLDLDACRSKILSYWAGRLAKQGGWVEEKRHQFWTFRHVVSALGLPFRASSLPETSPFPTRAPLEPILEDPSSAWAAFAEQCRRPVGVVAVAVESGSQATDLVT